MAEEEKKICIPKAIAPDCICRVPGQEHVRTSDFYATCNLPKKLDCPDVFKGYGCQVSKQHPLFKTTSNEYGWYPPGYYSVPTSYFPLGQTFSLRLMNAGMYRNFSLNTGMEKSFY